MSIEAEYDVTKMKQMNALPHKAVPTTAKDVLKGCSDIAAVVMAFHSARHSSLALGWHGVRQMDGIDDQPYG